MPNATAATMHPFVGMVGDLHLRDDYPLTVQVKVLDVRTRWGALDYLVTPVVGSGEKWVSGERVPDLGTPA
jgi:hypothetical protein